jgi:hypothetical protein
MCFFDYFTNNLSSFVYGNNLDRISIFNLYRTLSTSN